MWTVWLLVLLLLSGMAACMAALLAGLMLTGGLPPGSLLDDRMQQGCLVHLLAELERYMGLRGLHDAGCS